MLRFLNRLVALVAVIGFAVAAVWLLWADRGTILGDRIISGLIDLGRDAERATMIDLIDRSDVPASLDQVGHATLWAIGVFLIGWLRLGRRSVMANAFDVAAMSLLFEFAQPLVSTKRGFETSDAIANWVGVGIGTTGLAIIAGTLRLAHIRR